MCSGKRNRPGRKLVWGLFLIALGGAFLLDRLDAMDMPHVGEIWPAIFLAMGAIHIVERRLGSGLNFLMMGAWFFACEYGWMGLTYRNSWPLLLVGVGLSIVVGALVGELPRRRRDEEVPRV